MCSIMCEAWASTIIQCHDTLEEFKDASRMKYERWERKRDGMKYKKAGKDHNGKCMLKQILIANVLDYVMNSL